MIKKTKPIFPYRKWEYNVKYCQYINSDELNEDGKHGWELICINNDFIYYKRQIEETEEKNPYQQTFDKWKANETEIQNCLIRIKYNLEFLIQSSMYDLTQDENIEINIKTHPILYGFNCCNIEVGAKENMLVFDVGNLIPLLAKFESKITDKKLSNVIVKDCDIIFYIIYGYDIKDSNAAPDMIHHFIDNEYLIYKPCVSAGIASIILSSLINFIAYHLYGCEKQNFAHYFENFVYFAISLFFVFIFADPFKSNNRRFISLLLWKCKWKIFLITSKIKRLFRRFLK